MSSSKRTRIEFKKSVPFTLGVELELEILDGQTLALTPEGPSILKILPENLRPYVKPEAYQSMLELVTPVCQGLEEVASFLERTLKELMSLAARKGLILLPLSLHPFSPAREQRLWRKKRYLSIFEELQLVGRRFIAQGLHVHLGMPDEETAIKTYNLLRPYLPLFLALSTSSPFYQGEETGFHSYRVKLFEVLPLAGLPRSFGSWAEFETLVNFLVSQGIISSFRDLWWDVRPKPEFGTVEVRICDVPGRFDDLLTIIALIQTLAFHLLSRKPPPGLPYEAIAYAKWQAARHGLEGLIIEPKSLRKLKFKALALELLKDLEKSAHVLGTWPFLKRLSTLLERKPVSYTMLALFRKGATFPAIIEKILEGYWA